MDVLTTSRALRLAVKAEWCGPEDGSQGWLRCRTCLVRAGLGGHAPDCPMGLLIDLLRAENDATE